MCGTPQKVPLGKNINELLAITHMHALFISVAIKWQQNLCIEVVRVKDPFLQIWSQIIP